MNTQASFALRSRNPDVLTCIANLSEDPADALQGAETGEPIGPRVTPTGAVALSAHRSSRCGAIASFLPLMTSSN